MFMCFKSSSVPKNDHDRFKRREELKEEKEIASFSSVISELRDITVRIVHAGGRIEMYHNAIYASDLIRKYPGMCVARPNVFKRPHESLLSADDVLMPGNKYFIIRSTTVEKLKRRHEPRRERMEEDGGHEPKTTMKTTKVDDAGDDCSKDSICKSRDFEVTKDSWSVLRNHVKGKRQFVPPIQRPRIWRESEWEPSLVSIQEVSP